MLINLVKIVIISFLYMTLDELFYNFSKKKKEFIDNDVQRIEKDPCKIDSY